MNRFKRLPRVPGQITATSKGSLKKVNLVNFKKKVGIGSDPRPPPWAKFPTFTENLFCKLPLALDLFQATNYVQIPAAYQTAPG